MKTVKMMRRRNIVGDRVGIARSMKLLALLVYVTDEDPRTGGLVAIWALAKITPLPSIQLRCFMNPVAG